MNCLICKEELQLCSTIHEKEGIKIVFACNYYECPIDYIDITILNITDE